jgi:hypothetical protein
VFWAIASSLNATSTGGLQNVKRLSKFINHKTKSVFLR